MKSLSKLSAVLLSIFLLTTNIANAQAPDFVYEFRTNDGASGPYTSWTVDSGSKTGSVGPGIFSPDLIQTTTYGGGSIGAYSLEVDQDGTDTITGTGGNVEAKYTVKVYVKDLRTVDLDASYTADVSYSGNSNSNREMYVGTFPFGSSYLYMSYASGTNSDDDDASGSATYEFRPGCSGGTSKTFASYPGETYYLVKETSFTTSTVIGGWYDGAINAQGTLSFSPTLGADAPTAEIEGPLVSGSPESNPDFDDTVVLNNISYDGDDTDSEEELEGICSASWLIIAPDGTDTTSSSLSGISVSANQQGVWHVYLTVTDNEGAQDSASASFTVGDDRTPKPGDGPSCYTDSGFSASANPGGGNASTQVSSSTPTRTSSIDNTITINSQTNFTSNTTALGNATHAYFARVVEEQGVNDANTRWYLVGGDGEEWNYGAASGSPTAPAGAFATLTEVTGGFELTDAGPLNNIAASGQYTYEFNSLGQLTKVIDPSKNEQVLTYNGSNQLTTVTDSGTNKTLEFTYNGSGLVTEIDENGTATVNITYTSDLITNIEREDSLSATVREFDFTYNADDLISTVKRDSDTDTLLTYEYTTGGGGVPLANITHPDGSTNYDYTDEPTASGASFRVTHTNAKSQDTTYDYDERGNLLKKITPTPQGAGSGITYTYTYDSDDNVLTASNGVTTYTYTYNSSGFVTEIEDQNGRYRAFTYSGSNLTEIEDNIGTLREYTYGNVSFPHSPTVVTDGDGDDWTFTYNSNGQVTLIEPPTGSLLGDTTITYNETALSDTYGLPTSIENGEGDVVDYDDYDDLGNLVSITTNPSGATYNTTEYTYDGASRLTEIEWDDSETYSYTYTGKDLTSVTDEDSTTTSYEHCTACSKMTGQSEPLSRELEWTLDSDFATTHFEDPGTNSTEFKYDNAKFLKEILFPDGKKYEFTTDSYGRRKTRKYPSSNTGTFTYDTSGRVTKYDFSGTNDDVDYTYFDDGRIKTVTDRNGTTTYAYTDDRQVESVSYNYSPRGVSAVHKLEYTYYPDGLLESMIWKSDTTTVASWDYDYDGAGRLIEVSNSYSEEVDYTYDGEGKITEQANANGTYTEYEYYEARNWVTKITHLDGATEFEEFEIEYDGGSNTVGNISNVVELDTSEIDYTYDALYRLTEEDRTGTGSYNDTYTYDVSGNITQVDSSSFATYDSANMVSAYTGGIVSYHSSGLPYKQGVPPYGCLQTNFDPKGQVTQIKECSGANTTNYIWDGHGRRSYRSGILTIFSGDKIVGEITNSGSGTPKRAYTWGPDGLAVMRDIGGTESYYYHFGPQGETRHLTDSSATVTDSYRYTAYGQTLYSSGSTENYHKYGGKYGYYTQGALGTILAGARVYYPNSRRWISRDPILFNGGVNLWEYVGGNPVIYVDPTGRARCKHSIATGVLSCTPNDGGSPISTEPGEGFSGQGACENNIACMDKPFHGPIPTGEYEIYNDTEEDGNWGVKPKGHIPFVSKFICKTLGIGRCDFKIHPGDTSWGCITIRTDGNGKWPETYEAIDGLLNKDDPNNTLTVVP